MAGSASAEKTRARLAHVWKQGPRLDPGRIGALQGLTARPTGVTARGWICGVLCVFFLAATTPYIDYVIRATRLSFNSVPLEPFMLLLGLAALSSAALTASRRWLRLTPQDLTLVFCMMFVTYALSGFGFMMTWATSVSASVYYNQSAPEMAAKVHNLFTPGFFMPPDPDPGSDAARPLAAFYGGLEAGEKVNWAAWGWPYLRWAGAMALLYGLWYGLSALFRRRWSEQERLPFPLAEVPEALIQGVDQGPGQGARGWMVRRPAFLWGMFIVLGVHTWNALAFNYNWIPNIPLEFRGLQEKYFTEPPWNNMGRLEIMVRPTMIGLAFLVSCEVSLSVVSFYWIHKVLLIAFGTVYGATLMQSGFKATGAGALLMVAALSFWVARAEVLKSLKEAITGRGDTAAPGEPSSRAIWLVLLACGGGVVAWLAWLGVSPGWAALSMFALVLMTVGLSRLVGEAGAFCAGLPSFPTDVLTWVAPATTMGAQNVALLSIWDRVLAGDFYRVVPMPNIMNSMRLATTTGLRMSTFATGLAVALVLTLVVSFFSFFATAHYAGGFTTLAGDWYGRNLSVKDAERIRDRVNGIQRYERLAEAARADGRGVAQISERDLPAEAKTDSFSLQWVIVGAVVLLLFTVMRTYVFWWPHPAGLVLWMCLGIMVNKLWFAFFVAWAVKAGVTKFGGMQTYQRVRPFFIGMVIGEAVAVVVGIAIAFLTGHRPLEIWLT